MKSIDNLIIQMVTNLVLNDIAIKDVTAGTIIQAILAKILPHTHEIPAISIQILTTIYDYFEEDIQALSQYQAQYSGLTANPIYSEV